MATISISLFHSTAEWEQHEMRTKWTPEHDAKHFEHLFETGQIAGLVCGCKGIELVSKETEGRLTRFTGLVDGTNKITITIL